jgi:hypothetical protein
MRTRWLLPLLGLLGCGPSTEGGGSDLAVVVGADLAVPSLEPCNGWLQWSQSSHHGGNVCVTGQSPTRVLQTIVIDPMSPDERGDADGDLLVHYQVPLVVDDDVYLEAKAGSVAPDCPPPDGGEVGCYAWDSQTWSEQRYTWSNGQLALQWTFNSDWKPVPSEAAGGFQPTFQPVVVGRFLYVPGGGGSVHKLDRQSGAELALLRPSPTAPLGADLYVASPLVADGEGHVYYNLLQLDHDQPLTADADAWLVQIDAADHVASADYAALVPNAPTGTTCHGTFGNAMPPPPLPWPPADVVPGVPVLPPAIDCGHQRPGVNLAPAIGADGTIFTASRAHHASRDSFLVAVKPDLTPKWATSLRSLPRDGCGVLVPDIGTATTHRFDCRPGARDGVEPATNDAPAGTVTDASTSTPVALPDGAVLYGTFTGYNAERGHLVKLSPDGKLLATYDFGWDYTPGLWLHDGTYSIVVKDNHYEGPGPYYVTQLDANLKVEWQYKSTNTASCDTDADGGVQCVSDHPSGFEWCINAPAVDDHGTVYATGEDGVLYAIGQGGTDQGHLFLNLSLGAAYTPVAIDHLGRIYAQNNGTLAVVGR